MLIKNVRLHNRDGLWSIGVKSGQFTEIARKVDADGTEVIDAGGCLALPPFVEPHIHLDSTLTAGQPRWNLSGTLFEGIECWSERKQTLSEDDVISRARKTIEWQATNGIQYIRTHVDVTDPQLTALRAMVKVREAVKELADLQIVAFPQEGILSYPKGIELMEKAMDAGADVVGAIPHFEFTREYGVESVEHILQLAADRGCLVDVHCDEIDDDQSRFVEVLAAKALKLGIGPRVTASHTTAMHSYNNAYASKLFRLFKMSGIHFVANPLINIHLQGRFDTYPKRRGMTRVKEMVAAGINVCLGHDDISDPWYPLGTGNMLQVLFMGLHVAQMMGYEQISNGIDLITVNSARALNLDGYGIEIGNPANFIILDAESAFDALRLQAGVLYSIRNGKIITRTNPRVANIIVDGRERVVDYRQN
jgi:cytosine/creatinine deaminase